MVLYILTFTSFDRKKETILKWMTASKSINVLLISSYVQKLIGYCHFQLLELCYILKGSGTK
jgi:hypothetical protein